MNTPKTLLVLLLVVTAQLLQAQFYDLYRSDGLPAIFKSYAIEDSLEAECLQNWQTNVEWQACNGQAIEFWETEVNKTYAYLLVAVDASLKQSLTDYHLKWEANLAAQKDLFFDVYKAKGDFFGREDYISYGGIMANNYRKHAYDLQMLLYYFTTK